MTDGQQHIMDNGDPRKYFSMIEHMADDDLDPYAYRLLGHYKRVCGVAGGFCYESIKTTAQACQMSTGMVSQTRMRLVDMGWITVTLITQESDDGKVQSLGSVVTVLDRWAENIARYADTPSPHEHPRSYSEDPPSPHETKKNTSKNNPPKKTKTARSRQSDPDFATLCLAYENEIALISQHMAETLSAALDDYPVQWCIDAIQIAVERNKRNWRYVEGILKNWQTEGREERKRETPRRAVPEIVPLTDAELAEAMERQMFGGGR